MVFRVVITSNCRFHKNNMTIINNKRKKSQHYTFLVLSIYLFY